MRYLTVLLFVIACGRPSPEARSLAAADSAFGKTAVVSTETSNGATPMFLVTSTGAKVLSWVATSGDSGDGAMHVRVESPGGGVVTSAIRDSLGGVQPRGETPPQIAAGPDGAIYALYNVAKDVGKRYPVSALRFVRSDDGGKSWSAPLSINEGEVFGSHSFHAIIGGADGAVYASWLSNAKDGKGVWLRASHDGGRTWEPSHPVYTDPTCPCCRTAMALGQDGTLYLAWRAVFEGNIRDIVLMSSKDRGATWSTPVRPHPDGWSFKGCPQAGPSLRVDAANTVHLSWWTGKDGAAGVWYARSVDGGATWKAEPIDTAKTARPSHIQLALAGDRVVIGWDGGHGEVPNVFVKSSGDKGASFGPLLQLTAPTLAATFPVLGIAQDSLVVAWTQIGDSAYRVLMEQQREPMAKDERMALPRVGQQEIFVRRAPVSALPTRE